MAPMKTTFNLLQKMGLSRPRDAEDLVDMNPFDRRLKMVSRARVVNHASLGAPVFRRQPLEQEV